MRLPSIITLLVSVVLFMACPSIADKQTVDKLLKESRGGPIYLTDKTFEKVVNGPRDFDLIVLLTAVAPQFGCQFCRVLQPEFDIVANSWHKTHGSSSDGLVFAVADLAKTQGIFKSLKLTHAPNLWIYKKSDDNSHYSSGYDIYKFPQVPQQVENLVQYIKHSLGHSVKIEKPFPWDKVITTVTAVVAVIVIVKVFFWKILAVIQSRKIWVAISLVSVLLFTAGHMFNAIRKTPYVAGDGHGGVAYFIGGHSNQVAIETQIIATIYAILAFSTIMLITKVPTLDSPQKQLMLAIILSGVIFVAYSFLISKFHVKNGGYPFWLLKL